MASICLGCTRPATYKGYCDRCQRIPTARPPSRPWKGKRRTRYILAADPVWRKLSKAYLDAHPWCARCALTKRPSIATVTDHILPVRIRPERKHDETNFQPLCVPCHSLKTGAERRGIAYDYVRQIQYRIGK